MTTNGRESITVAAVEGIGRIPRQEWNSMVGEDDSPFLEWDWLNALEESGSANARTGWAPCHLVARRTSDRKMVAACPLYLKSHSMGEFVFDHGWADAAERAGLSYYPKLLVGIPFTPHTGRRIMTANDTDRRFVIELMGQALARLCVENKLSSVHVNFCSEDEAEAL